MREFETFLEARGRIKRPAFRLRHFVGVEAAAVDALAAVGVRDAAQLLETGRTAEQRRRLAERAVGAPPAVEELVRLSDLSRLPGVKGIRARLYRDCGVDSVAKLASYEPTDLLALTSGFAARTGFARLAPLPKEVASAIAAARHLPVIVEEQERPFRRP